MPFIEINGAQLYYEILGEERTGRAPIVLIHGSTSTGCADWRLVAPLLAREYRVIVPDCRGHGQSANPNRSYSFKELAGDVAELARALGYERAHIVGHSNGGNVALVTLLEHPEVVQTAVLQAANAYVSPDLVEKEPAIFDPDRVAQEAPEWMAQMMALHGPTHGPDYWRDLLRMTVREIVSEPNYTPADLACVQRPTLVIQGEHDRVNALARHAQFIAHHVPDAELWIPPDVGHDVHVEALCAWVERVLNFLTRRGDEANDALYRLRRARYADDRETIFAVRAGWRVDGGVDLTGQVLAVGQRQAALERTAAFSPQTVDVQVLLHPETPWALLNRAVTDLRREPRRLAERVSQVRLGEALRILEERTDWARVQVVHDGYLGWTQTASLHWCDESAAQAYRVACDALVQAELAPAYAGPSPEGFPIAKLPFGVAMPIAERRDGLAAVRLPDGCLWWVADDALLPLARRPAPTVEGIAFTLALIRRFAGAPYLWGGRTPFGFDCSGLAQTFWGFMGVALPRDADQQFRAGAPVQGEPQPGDLLFFGDPADESAFTPLNITHVAISLGGSEFIHANIAAGGVSYNSIAPHASNYRPWLREHLIGVRRFVSERVNSD
jgi:pimeloyl-ACP methyl ester carboxylesterase